MKNIAALMFLVSMSLGSAFAADKLVSTDPQSWRLQDYIGNPVPVTVWYADPACSTGRLTFDNRATEGELNRFWLTVTLAKVTGKKILVFFNDDAGADSCIITSFALQEGS
ncbi:hypothetical protein [Burkholderia gladioli]|uniref:hypothetical protein n=1 Tax=Burkholderia gladioli TaxID=28095 RepID=UPI0011D21622|nr:hypothetical protein [Burkholderia gladioli]MBW5287611.1 hypothetical protein [Burkholderia gladioli]